MRFATVVVIVTLGRGILLEANAQELPSTLTVPITIHTSETAGVVRSGGTPISAFIEVIPQCALVECPPRDTTGTGELPTVVWETDPAPGQVFVIDEIEELGTMTLEIPSDLPEGAVISFLVHMKEADTGRHLSTETKRFARDTIPPVITSFDVREDGEGNLVISATVQDEASSVGFMELLVSRDGGGSFTRSPMDWQSGDFLAPTRFQTMFEPSGSEEILLKVRAEDEAGNSSETPPCVAPCVVGGPIEIGGLGNGPDQPLLLSTLMEVRK